MPRSNNSSGVYRPKYEKKNALLACLAQRPSARSYCGGHLLQATISGPCHACLVSHPWQLVPYAALGLGRDGVNNLASSRLELKALDDSSVETIPHSVLDSTKCPHKYRDIKESAKYLNISVRGVLDIMNSERPRRQSTAKYSASFY